MNIFAFVLAVLFPYYSFEDKVPCGIRNGNDNDRIVGGQEADFGEFPWQISLQHRISENYKFSHICGGSIVNSEWVICAAHCVANDMNPENYFIFAGKNDLKKKEATEQGRGVAKIILNKFNPKYLSRDISLLKLKEPFNLNPSFVAPICIPDDTENFEDIGTVTGFGFTSENGKQSTSLLKVDIPVMSFDTCKAKYKRMYANFFTKCQICTLNKGGGKDACQGDSGGPLACKNKDDKKYYLRGIVSFGVGCARKNNPGVYTEVSCYYDWIKKTISK